MNPQVVHLIMCDRAYADPQNLVRVIVRGIQVRLRARSAPPIQHDFVALVMMIGFTGSGECWVRVVEEATGQRVAESRRRRFWFPQDPEELVAFQFRVTQCPLPRYGQYRLELWLKDQVIAVRPFGCPRGCNMPDHADDEPIQLGGGRLVEIDMPMINLTGIPDEQFRSVDDDGNPVVESESMDRPLIDFDDLPLSTPSGPADNGIPTPGTNGAASPAAPSSAPPKSV